MMTCDFCQSQLLAHLYGLLESDDRTAIVIHLNSCPACRAALDKAREQQRILAAAAKSEFPDVRFSAVTPKPTVAPTVENKQPRRGVAWGRWAVAACILVLLGSAVGFAGIAWFNYRGDVSHANDDLVRIKAERDALLAGQRAAQQALQDDIVRIQEQLRLIEAQYRDDLTRVEREYKTQPVEFNVSHPKTIQAGAKNNLKIEARRKAVAKEHEYFLVAVVVDEKTQSEVARMPLTDGNNNFDLPADLPLKPGAQLSLRVLAVEERGPAVAGGSVAAAAFNPLGGPATLLAAQTQKTLIQEMLPLVTSLFVTHLTTDRPLYRPGETVHFRSLTLERANLKPATEEFELRFRLVRTMGQQEQTIEVLDPETGKPAQMIGGTRLKGTDGKALLGPDGKELRGIGAGSFQLPDSLPGGEYTLIVSETHDRFPAEKRRLIVNRYQAPRLLKDVDFTRKSYGPGDTVTAVCKVAPVEGGRVISDQPVTVSAEVDGLACEMLLPGMLVTDKTGSCVVKFRLPATIERGLGTLAVTFRDGGNIETTVEPIPIVVNKLKVEFFPEGGELVAGVPNRVYFQVRTLLNRPAELRGRIVDKGGKEIAAIATLNDDKELGVNQGMGSFEFTPEAGQVYELKIDSPERIEGEFKLPKTQTSGVVLHLTRGVVTDQIDLSLTNVKRDRKLLIGAYCRGQLLDHQMVEMTAGQQKALTLKPATSVAGVYRVTVFEMDGEKLTPVAERLLYRRSPEKLNLQVFTDKKLYTPGDRVTLSLTATDQHNKPAPAVVVISVVDKSVLKLRNDRTARAMPTHFLLTSEVRGPEDLEHADFLLAETPKAEVALDLLLGTQGWRRFLEQKQPAPVPADKGDADRQKEDVKRFLVQTGQAPQQMETAKLTGSGGSKLAAATAAKHLQVQKALAAKEAAQDAKVAAAQEDVRQANVRMATSESDVANATERYDEFLRRLRDYGGGALLLLLCVGGAVLIVVGSIRANNERPHALAFLATGSLCFLILMVGGLGYLISQAKMFQPMAQMEAARGAAPKAMAGGGGQVADWAEEGMAREQEAAKMDRGGGLGAQPKAGPPPGAKKDGMLKDLPNMVEADKQKGMGPAKLPQPKSGAHVGKGKGPGFDKEMDGDGWPKADKMPDVLVMKQQLRAEDAMDGQFFAHDPDRELRRQGKFADITRQHLGFVEQQAGVKMPAAVKLLVSAEAFLVREYAHKHETSADGFRRDFAETVYWHPALVLPGEKKVNVHFDLSDAVTQFQVQVWGHTLDGRLGAVTTDIAARLPFSLDAKLPTEISHTDKVIIPVALSNDADKHFQVKLKAEADKLKIQGPAERTVTLDANKSKRELLVLHPAAMQGEAKLRLSGLCEPFAQDSIERGFKIVPEGFPVAGKYSDLLEKTSEHVVKLPARREDWVKGTLKLQAQVFPSTLADLQKGLEALLREPGGCFEQTSSSNYPNIMILDYLKESDQVKPEVEKKALAMLDRGYGKLVSFECVEPKTMTKKEGYEWFGQTAPPHEALTAYGLLQFLDMKKYQPVDEAMLERTKAYLLKQRNGKGGFLRNARALDSFGRAPDHITDAYIVWALSEAKVKEDISLELNAVVANAEKSEDPYMLALAGLSLLNQGKSDKALSLLKTLRTKQKADGSLMAKETSITHSGGTQLAVETTSLAVLAWLRANQPQEFGESVRKSADWIGKQRGAFGGYGSTQSTVLALKALIAYTSANKRPAEAGELRLLVNGQEVAFKKFAAGTLDPLIVQLADEMLLKTGENTVRVEITGKNAFPFTLTWSYMAITPANREACPVRLTTKLSDTKAAEGQTLRVTADLENVSGSEQGMAVAIVGLPGGCAVPTDLQELRNLVKDGTIDAFEVNDREVVLYWRGLARDAKKAVSFSVICQVPGTYRGPASRGYLYYNNDERWWVSPLEVGITPRD
jgi:hypothetical protein